MKKSKKRNGRERTRWGNRAKCGSLGKKKKREKESGAVRGGRIQKKPGKKTQQT